ncbi:cellulase family glycosylhydrolase [Streptomyces triculaminicus]|uniref:Cellulase family glycosylhydrolase n=2 Tax=Streptomyces TaxID=1883 RepID=A0A939FQG3_9ACTN|nr:MULTISPECIES: cellulase family glycosylhydrolase [Streptomyces]MBO0655009.1 cellulase family glycosylhydrolase [Streptomyces triculaminicus]QSY51121.1 cellulase family glycosylhydrolase [Streptomyces griseocarneus]
MPKRRLRTAAFLAVTTVLALLVPTTGATAGTEGGIPRLTDDHGRALTLRGWNLADKEHRGERALESITERSLRDMAAQGFDFARLAVFWDDLEPRRGQYSERYLRRIERILDWAHAHRVRVVIDAHQDVYGPAFGGHRGIPEWATRTDGLSYRPHPDDWFAEYFEPAVQAAFEHLYEDPDLRRAQTRMWRTLAARLAGHPAVFGYDLINEPMGRMRPGEDLFAAARRIEATQVTPMYNRIADAIREVDRKHWLFVEPTPAAGEGRPTGLGRVDDPKVVYAPHFYNAVMEAGGDYDPASGWLEAYEREIVRYPREHRVPVVVGEWGPRDSSLPNMRRFYEDAVASIGRYASGWASWEWCYGGGYCALQADGRFQPNKERTVRPYAPAVAGTPRTEAYDQGTHAYRLTYAPHPGGITELSLPPSPHGWRITVDGPAWAATRAVPPGERGRVQVRAARWAGAPVTVTVTGG